MALLGELRRRNIFKVSLAYMLVSWIVVQIAGAVLPGLQTPPWVMQGLVLFLILAFPIAVLLSWAFELTPDGLKATADVDKTQSITVQTGRRLNKIVFGLIAVAAVVFVVDFYVFPTQPTIDPEVDHRRTIAILPYGHENAAAALADGIHEDLRTRLATVADLRVISRHSVLQYSDTTKALRQIGEELSAGSVLTSALRSVDDMVQIDLQLFDAETEELIADYSYEFELTAANLFATQGEIATAIADELDVETSDTAQARIESIPTESMDALDAYFNGILAGDKGGANSLRESIEQLRAAVEIDPEFSLAWTALAQAWLAMPHAAQEFSLQRLRGDTASAAIKAVTFDPESPTALAVLGWHTLVHNYDWSGAEDQLLRALEIDATNSYALQRYAQVLSWQGRHDEAIAVAERAYTIDPLSPAAKATLSEAHANAGRWDLAFDLIGQAAESTSVSDPDSGAWLTLLRAKRYDEAAANLQEWAAATARDVDAASEIGNLIVQAQSADEPLQFPEDLISRLQVDTKAPELYAAIGDADNTLLALENAYQRGRGFPSLLSIEINPAYDFIRETPRFAALLEAVGLED